MESNYVVIDSNVLIAFYNEDDVHHNNAVLLSEEIKDKTLVVHPYVIQEVVTVLTYRFGLVLAQKFLIDMQNANNIMIVSVNITADIAYFLKATVKISFTDFALIRLAEYMNASLLTFDQQMLSLLKRKK